MCTHNHTLIPSPSFTLPHLDVLRHTLVYFAPLCALPKKRGDVHSQSSKPHVHTCASSPACVVHHCACTMVAACTVPPTITTTTPAPQQTQLSMAAQLTCMYKSVQEVQYRRSGRGAWWDSAMACTCYIPHVHHYLL